MDGRHKDKQVIGVVSCTILKQMENIKDPGVKTLVKGEFAGLMLDKHIVSKKTGPEEKKTGKEFIAEKKARFMSFFTKMLKVDEEIATGTYAYTCVYSPATDKYVGVGSDSHNSG